MNIHKKLIKAEDGPENSVVYYDEDGNKLIRYWKSFAGQPVDQARTRSWRNNNPGNLSLGPFARKNGAIGGAGRIPNKEKKISSSPFFQTTLQDGKRKRSV